MDHIPKLGWSNGKKSTSSFSLLGFDLCWRDHLQCLGFLQRGEEDTPIGAMLGCYMVGWRHGLLQEVAKARAVGVNSIVLFPKVYEALKNPTGDEAYNNNGLVARTIRLLKDKYPDLIIYIDVALDPYSSDGQDGIVREDGMYSQPNVLLLCFKWSCDT
ncbi:hypothetical protein Bca101_025006 [Brassica carinata]